MSTTPDTTTSDGSANADHQVSDKGKVASRNGPWHHREQKTKPLSTTNEKMKFEGKCDDLSGYIYHQVHYVQLPRANLPPTSSTWCKKEVLQFDPRQASDMPSIPWEVPKQCRTSVLTPDWLMLHSPPRTLQWQGTQQPQLSWKQPKSMPESSTWLVLSSSDLTVDDTASS